MDIICPHCKTTLECDESLVGEIVNCPKCLQMFEIEKSPVESVKDAEKPMILNHQTQSEGNHRRFTTRNVILLTALGVCMMVFGLFVITRFSSSGEKRNGSSSLSELFAKAKEAATNGKVDFYGFYIGMGRTDFKTLIEHYGLDDGEWYVKGDPIYAFHFSLKGVRKITNGGNSYEELCRAVSNRVGGMSRKVGDREHETWDEYKTLDGVCVTMAESRLFWSKIQAGFVMIDTTGTIRKESDLKAKQIALSWKSESKIISVTPSVTIELQSIPGPLWFGKTEITQAQWEAVMGHKWFQFKGTNHPVECVSWNECQEFLMKLNEYPSVTNASLSFRLPTREEWEFACGAGDSGDFCWLKDGTEITQNTVGRVAWLADNSNKTIHPVAQKQPNIFGLYDMLGNVREWTATMDQLYFNSDESRFEIGGDYDTKPEDFKSRFEDCRFNIYSFSPDEDFGGLGFRLCAESKTE
ncbi:MAG: SUMF1/EgtB/PvdO family nonheme iron enzyme, partial [Muribaculaceae bacterium]|nr:SUMF1/EgtB/PvdO family nonheme iron enzyme [Muribaculaceae bacterium]